ncbi:hypothetical protein [Thermococcus nautili]|uniref:Uncharacterized protein n=1 Tax=Thermococcus nautili TaxID=195522 RepID=W8NVI7_9EURY|nr:hypothetical protein [Thermococcus nautili]AHL23273.1 hypothetical protein BD01_1670 [Thermococcus nautili]
MKALVISVDRSRQKRTIYALVEVDYNNLRHIREKGSWLKHLAELPKQERRNYIAKFPGRFEKLKPYLEKIIITPFLSEIKDEVANKSENTRILILDDAVLKKFSEYSGQKNVFKESLAKRRYEFRHVVLLTDNLAYIGREIYEKNPNPNALKKELRKRGIL